MDARDQHLATSYGGALVLGTSIMLQVAITGAAKPSPAWGTRLDGVSLYGGKTAAPPTLALQLL